MIIHAEVKMPQGSASFITISTSSPTGCVSYIFFTALGAIAVTGIFLVEFEEHFEVSTTYVSLIGAVEIGSIAILGKLSLFFHI